MSEETSSEVFQTHFTELVTKAGSEKSEIITRLIENIDNQGLDNFTLFESEHYPGLVVPYTKVQVDNLKSAITPPGKESINSGSANPRYKITFVVFQGFAQNQLYGIAYRSAENFQ